jgi:transcriptional regulator with XRE-family HTH domain
MTQAQLARKAKTTQKTISKLETTSDIRPAFDIVANVADALDVDPRALRFGPDPRAERKAS